MQEPADYILQILMLTALGGDAAAAPVSISGKAENWQGSCGIVHSSLILVFGVFYLISFAWLHLFFLLRNSLIST